MLLLPSREALLKSEENSPLSLVVDPRRLCSAAFFLPQCTPGPSALPPICGLSSGCPEVPSFYLWRKKKFRKSPWDEPVIVRLELQNTLMSKQDFLLDLGLDEH